MLDDNKNLQGAIERLKKYRAQNANWPQHCINVGLYLNHIDALLDLYDQLDSLEQQALW